MGKLWLLLCNSFEDALRRRVIYILLFVVLLFGLYGAYQLVYMRMAASAGELEMLAGMRGRFVQSLFETMELLTGVLAIYLGSVTLSTELRNRTLLTVLSRPVGRVSFFFAKWLGTFAFLALFLGCGVLAGVAVALYWQLQPSPIFFLGIALMFLEVAILSALGLALSSRLHPVVAGGFTTLLWILPGWTGRFASHPNAALRLTAAAARYLAPAELQESLLENGLLKGLLNPDYGIYVAVLAENALYAFAVVLAGALLFRHREIVQ